MNYEKIGLFLAKKRKDLGMTQKNLADLLGLTDRAISRWERGVGCPDIGILENLSNILGVSILEILHGQELDSNENKAIVDLLKIEKKKQQKRKNIIFLGLNLFGIFFLFSFLSLYCIPKKICYDGNYLHTIVSPSMEPVLHVKDKIVIQPVDISQVQVGDIISFTTNEEPSYGFLVTHRVTDKQVGKDGEILLKTKGDTNYFEDNGWVTEQEFLGILKTKFQGIGKIIPSQPVSFGFALCFLCGIVGVGIFDFIFFRRGFFSFSYLTKS